MEAAHTFFMANPEHMEMQQNIEDYRETAGVEAIQLVDREARPHMVSSATPVPAMGSQTIPVQWAPGCII